MNRRPQAVLKLAKGRKSSKHQGETAVSAFTRCGCPSGCGSLMTILKKLLRDRRFHRLAGAALVLGVGGLLLAWKMGLDGAGLKAAWREAEGFLKAWPLLLFAALVVLPGFPVPTSALCFLAGTVWRDRPVMACAICLTALALNMTWTYWVAARPGRRLVERLLAATRFKIPDSPQGNRLRLLLIVRLTPGIPLFLQNYLLGFMRIPFRLYLPVSLGCSGLISIGVVLSGAGVADGNLTPVVAGVGLIVVGLIVVQMIRQKLKG
jgi:uncharacterized membrane protein YdjX (TVP38/TMEM64 family)